MQIFYFVYIDLNANIGTLPLAVNGCKIKAQCSLLGLNIVCLIRRPSQLSRLLRLPRQARSGMQIYVKLYCLNYNSANNE